MNIFFFILKSSETYAEKDLTKRLIFCRPFSRKNPCDTNGKIFTIRKYYKYFPRNIIIYWTTFQRYWNMDRESRRIFLLSDNKNSKYAIPSVIPAWDGLTESFSDTCRCWTTCNVTHSFLMIKWLRYPIGMDAWQFIQKRQVFVLSLFRTLVVPKYVISWYLVVHKS